MRYKFRGKRVDNSEWVCGSVCTCKKCLEEVHPVYGSGHVKISALDGEYGNVMVLANTIGQWTGLLDKNGVEIYENDEVYFEAMIPGEKDMTGAVKQIEGCWMIDNGERAEFLYQECSPVEVIGNIHDKEE